MHDIVVVVVYLKRTRRSATTTSLFLASVVLLLFLCVCVGHTFLGQQSTLARKTTRAFQIKWSKQAHAIALLVQCEKHRQADRPGQGRE